VRGLRNVGLGNFGSLHAVDSIYHAGHPGRARCEKRAAFEMLREWLAPRYGANTQLRPGVGRGAGEGAFAAGTDVWNCHEWRCSFVHEPKRRSSRTTGTTILTCRPALRRRSLADGAIVNLPGQDRDRCGGTNDDFRDLA
jgi:hypothetical protein